MSEDTPIWQTGVEGKVHRKRAIGRLFIQNEDVFYFPELPLKRGSFTLAAVTATIGTLLLFSLIPIASMMFNTLQEHSGLWVADRSGAFAVPIAGLALLFTAFIQFMIVVRGEMKARKHVLTEDEFLGTSLEERFALSPDAYRFKLGDVEEVSGDKTLWVRTQDGEAYRFKAFPENPTLLHRLKGVPADLPKEARVDLIDVKPMRSKEAQ